jgi:NAD(P)-dependent dehydrogenase (short-subunit alcohol dehydrogenase family)
VIQSPFQCAGKIVLVTGAASGIGRQSAFEIAAAGGTVLPTDRNEQGLREAAGRLPAGGPEALCGDITVPADVDRLIGACPPLNGIVHSAGIIKLYPGRAYNDRRFHGVTDTDCMAPLLLTAALLKCGKIQPGASIIFISSIMSEVGTELNGVYAAAKAGLVATARCLALELAPKGIRVNCISPAFVRTPMLDQIGQQTDLAAFEKAHPLGFGNADDVAYAAVFLVSQASRWITGTNLIVDGGYSAR